MEKKKNKKKNKKSTDTKVKNNDKVSAKTTEVVKEVKVETKETPKKEHKEEKRSYTLFKVLAICLLVAFVLTWIIPSGSFGTDSTTSTYGYIGTDPLRLGIHQVFLALLYALNYYLIQIVYVLIVGLFYGVISKTNGYKSLVEKAVNFWQPRKKAFVLVHSLFLALLTSLVSDYIVVIIFIPFIISVASRLGFGKLRSVALPIASMGVGIIGQTMSPVCIDWLITRMSIKATDSLGIRIGIFAIAYILFNCLFILSMKKEKCDSTDTVDLIEITGEEVKVKKTWPYAVMFTIILVIMVLGFVSWSTMFDIDVFTNFHTWLTEKLTITMNGEDTPILGYILGTSDALYNAEISENPAFGNWDLYTFSYVIMIITLFVKLISKMKFSEALEGAIDGIKRMIRPALMLVFAYTMFVIIYQTNISAFIVDKIVGETFNPFSATLANAIASFMHVDFGYNGYLLGTLYVTRFADYTNLMTVIMTSVNGLVSLVAPTSIVLVTGLSMYNISYKKWLQYIWKFVVIMLVILLILFTLIAYI